MKAFIQQEREALQRKLTDAGFDPWAAALLNNFDQGWKRLSTHGDFERWQQGFLNLTHLTTRHLDFSQDYVEVGSASDTAMTQDELFDALQQLSPWRKGPFNFFGMHIDTEWHSDWKWQRVSPHISSLKDKTVLDIGCGSGYHVWRMSDAQPKLVLGVDPMTLFAIQFSLIKYYAGQSPAFFLPVGVEALPENMACFDTVFSMGVLYHRPSPIDHLRQLNSLLNQGGELVLETLIVDQHDQACLTPSGRYAKMRNVWFIPSVSLLETWLQRCGFTNIRCVDVNQTSVEEQRSTDWMRFESLPDYLDPSDHSKTIEGYPAPIRATLIANKV